MNNFIGVQQTGTLVPENYALEQNYPNPFNPSTTVKYQIPNAGNVLLEIYDISGKKVSVLMNEYKTEGYYLMTFNAQGLPSGIYFCKLTSGGFTDTKKMILVK